MQDRLPTRDNADAMSGSGARPSPLDAQAEAIHRALEMPPEERRERIDAIRSWVREHDLGAWIDVQLRALDAEPLESAV